MVIMPNGASGFSRIPIQEEDCVVVLWFQRIALGGTRATFFARLRLWPTAQHTSIAELEDEAKLALTAGHRHYRTSTATGSSRHSDSSPARSTICRLEGKNDSTMTGTSPLFN